MAGRSHSLSKALRRRVAGLVGAEAGKGDRGSGFPLSGTERGSGGEVSSPRGSGNQGLKALLVVLGVCLAGSAWGQDLQVAGRGKIREKLR